MLDSRVQPLLRPLLERAARRLGALGCTADGVTLAGFALGLAAALAIAFAAYGLGLVLLLASRLADGLDGALARLTQPTDRGGFLDIVLDFIFYAAIPLGFAVADPVRHALPACVLLASFIGTGSSFLAFAALAEKRGMASLALPDKSFYFVGGLTEATETIGCFALMCLWPAAFAHLAYGFAALCALTALARVWWGWRAFAPGRKESTEPVSRRE